MSQQQIITNDKTKYYIEFSMAFHNNELNKIQYYIENKIFTKDTTVQNESLWTKALLFSNLEIVKYIFSLYDNDITKAPKGVYKHEVFVHLASKNKDSNVLNFLLDFPFPQLDMNAGLDAAVAKDNYDNVLLLLNKGRAEPNYGLHNAVILNNKYIEILLSAGADLSFKSNTLDCIEFALVRDHIHPLIYALMPDLSNELYVAIFNNNLTRINELSTDSVKVNFTYRLLPSLLQVAVRYSNLSTIQLVHSLFNNTNYRMPAHKEINQKLGGNSNIINMVIRREFNIDIYDYVFNIPNIDINNVGDNLTALQYVIKHDNSNMDKLLYLLNKGSNVNVITNYNGTCGHLCVYNSYSSDNLSIMKLLLEYGLNLELGYPSNTSVPASYRNLSVINLCYNMLKPDPRKIIFELNPIATKSAQFLKQNTKRIYNKSSNTPRSSTTLSTPTPTLSNSPTSASAPAPAPVSQTVLPKIKLAFKPQSVQSVQSDQSVQSVQPVQSDIQSNKKITLKRK